MNNSVGQFLGRYQIVEQLGEGGMATVFRAFDTRLERDVAVKVIRVEKGADAQFLGRFEREARALARLSHPNIVHVNDYGDQDGVPYVVMDYLPGGTLKDKMGAPMPYQEAARLLAPIARALDFAHHMHIVHRDVKPANILLAQTGTPMLSDFGIAKILEEKTSELTGTGVGIGTPDYMAPEQGAGLKVDYRADIYALGVVYYELVTGRKPFRADTPIATVLKHMTEPLPRPRIFVRDLPEAVEKVIFKAMAKKPEDRYADMAAFAGALEKLAISQAVPEVESIDIGGQKVSKKTALIGGASIAAALGGLGLVLVCVIAGYFVYKGLPGNATPGPKAQATPVTGKNVATLAGGNQPTPVKSSTQKGGTQTGQSTGNMGGMNMVSQYRQGKISQGNTMDAGEIVVPVGSKFVSFQIAWQTDGTLLSMVVLDPNGNTVDALYPNQSTASFGNSISQSVGNPIPGKWVVKVAGANVPAGEEEFTVMMSCDDPQLPAGVLAQLKDVIGSGGMGVEGFYVPENTAKITVTVSWKEPGVKLEAQVTDTDEEYINENYCTTLGLACPANAQFSNTSQSNTITITDPKSGWWRLGVEGRGNKTGKDVDFELTVSVP
jgi:serine/threonine protein kinase